jgi:hypothetical protein
MMDIVAEMKRRGLTRRDVIFDSNAEPYFCVLGAGGVFEEIPYPAEAILGRVNGQWAIDKNYSRNWRRA